MTSNTPFWVFWLLIQSPSVPKGPHLALNCHRVALACLKQPIFQLIGGKWVDSSVMQMDNLSLTSKTLFGPCCHLIWAPVPLNVLNWSKTTLLSLFQSCKDFGGKLVKWSGITQIRFFVTELHFMRVRALNLLRQAKAKRWQFKDKWWPEWGEKRPQTGSY